MTLEDSTTYRWILEQGEAKGEAKGEARGRLAEARALVTLIGTRRFGPPSAAAAEALAALADRDRLERIADRIIDGTDWNDLLATP